MATEPRLDKHGLLSEPIPDVLRRLTIPIILEWSQFYYLISSILSLFHC